MSATYRSTGAWIALVALSAGSGCCAGASAPIASTAKAAINAPSAPTPALSSERRVAARLDALLEKEWKASGVAPSKPASDAQFLRRTYLDIAGTLPSPEVVVAFLEDRSPDKTARTIDSLLASPRYAERWASYWEDVLLRDKVKANIVDRAAFRAWLHARFAEDAPWDRVVRELLTATGKNSPGGAAAERRLAAAGGASEAEEEGVNGAVNWILQFNRSTEDLAGAASRELLGVQIQCAQCHDHKTEKWTTSDFRHFAASFARTAARPVDEREKGMMRTFEVVDAERARRPGKKATPEQREIAGLKPAALDGTELTGDAPRAELAAWITAPDNPWFAKAIVNRMWALFLGRGFVEPVDDLRPSNPARAEPALAALAADFVENGYDLKRLIRVICATRAYGLSAGSPENEAAWAAFRPRALAAPVLLDAILTATKIDPILDEAFGDRADALRARMRTSFRFLFDVDEQSASADFEGTIPQALALLNGLIVGHGSSALVGSALAEVLAMPGSDEAKIESLYLRALSRKPSAEETAKWVRFINEAPGEAEEDRPDAAPAKGPLGRLGKRAPSLAKTPKDRAYEDLFWALLDSSEFAFQH